MVKATPMLSAAALRPCPRETAMAVCALAVSQAEDALQQFGSRSGRLVRIVDEEDTAGELAATGFEVPRADGLEGHRDQQQRPRLDAALQRQQALRAFADGSRDQFTQHSRVRGRGAYQPVSRDP